VAIVDRLLAVNLANVPVAIEPARFKQDQEGANIAATLLHDLSFGGGVVASDRSINRSRPATVVTIRSKGIVRPTSAPAMSG
jgi:hypothetical protein